MAFFCHVNGNTRMSKQKINMGVKITKSSASRLRENRILFFCGLAILVALVAAVAILTLSQLHDAAKRRAFATTQSLAKSVALSIDWQISTIDVALLAASNEINQQIATGKPDQKSITQMLDQQIGLLHHVSILRATNKKGEVIYGSGTITTRLNNSDRNYFVRLRDDPKAGLVISAPHIGRSNQKWSWIFARRLNNPDGSFGGVVFASVTIDSIHKMFADIKADSGHMISLHDANMGLVARYSTGNNYFPNDDKGLSPTFFNALRVNPTEGYYAVERSRFDDANRLYSYSRNKQYGFLVNVGIEREAAFAEWRKQAWVVGGLVAAFILASLIFSWLISRGWKRQENSMAALQGSQDSLRETQQIAKLGRSVYDLRTNLWTSSNTLDDIFGIGPDYPRDALGWLGLVATEYREEMQTYMNTVIEQQLPFEREYGITRHSDGETRWVHHKGLIQLDAEGKPFSFVCTVQDITARKQIEDALRESEDQFRIIAASAQDAIVMMDAKGEISFWNPAAESIFGYSSDEALGRNLHQLLAPERFHAAFQAGFSRFRLSGEGGAVGRMLELAALRKDGIEIPIELSLSAVKRKDQWVAISIVRDISERKKAGAALQDSHETLQSILETTPDAFWRADSQGKLLYVNPAYCKISGYSREELLTMQISDLEAMESAFDTEERIKYISKHGYAQFETRHRRKDGSIWNIEASVTYRDTAGGQVLAFLRDITERKLLHSELQQIATTDHLTGTINRRQFMELAQNEHRRAIRLHHSMAIALIDLDHLKRINDSLGHATGDLVLQALTRTIQKNIRGIDIFARLGGDEFVLLLPGAQSKQAYEVVERARMALATELIECDGKTISITISAGIASISNDDDTFEILMSRADLALYQSKATGRNRVTVDHDLM